MELCERLLERGVFAQGIRPPTVPDGLLAPALHGDGDPPRGGAAPSREAGRDGGARDGPHRRPQPPDRIRRLTVRGTFVTGTGTEVGKTVVAAVIARSLAATGQTVAVFKPAVTGLDERRGEPDHALLRRAAGSAQSDEEIAPYRYGRRPPRTWPRRWPARRSTRAGCSQRRAPPPRAPTRSSARGSAGCSSRSLPATWCATSRSTWRCRWSSPPRPGSARSTTPC